MRASILLNADAGTLRALARSGSRQAAQRLVEETFAARGWRADVRLVPAKHMVAALDQAIGGPADTVIVGGGDGTISRALGRMAGSAKTFGILPLGTVNLLGRDLDLPNDLVAAIHRLCQAEPGRIDLATLNGRPFHSISGLGFFGRMAREREKARQLALPRWLAFGLAAMRAVSKRGIVRLTITTHAATRVVDAAAVLVTNNRYRGDSWRRHRLDEGLLEVHMLGADGVGHRLRAGLDVMRGRWRDNPTIETLAAEAVEVVSHRPRLWVATDGELRREPAPLRYRVCCRALKLLIPRPAAEGTADGTAAEGTAAEDTAMQGAAPAGRGQPAAL